MLLLLQLGARFEGEVWFERKTGAGRLATTRRATSYGAVGAIRLAMFFRLDSTRLESAAEVGRERGRRRSGSPNGQITDNRGAKSSEGPLA
jgi:hypothetical protein